MICTVTPNPALDLGGTVKSLTPNEKNYVFNEVRSAGGNGINAARIIQRLGQPVIATGFLGGTIGKEMRFLLEKEKIHHHFVNLHEDTRINLTITNEKSGTQTRLSFPGPLVKSSERAQLDQFVTRRSAHSLVLIGGSLPQGFESSHLVTLLEKLRRRKIPCLVDIPGHNLKKVLASASPDFIKPNLTEFNELTGRHVSTIPSIIKAAKKFTRRGITLCVSSVEDGALLITPEKVWYGRAPRVKVKSTVGAGDSMVGAITAQLWKDHFYKFSVAERKSYWSEKGGELLRRGLASACATLIEPSLTLGNKKTMESFVRRIEIQEIG